MTNDDHDDDWRNEVNNAMPTIVSSLTAKALVPKTPRRKARTVLFGE